MTTPPALTTPAPHFASPSADQKGPVTLTKMRREERSADLAGYCFQCSPPRKVDWFATFSRPFLASSSLHTYLCLCLYLYLYVYLYLYLHLYVHALPYSSLHRRLCMQTSSWFSPHPTPRPTRAHCSHEATEGCWEVATAQYRRLVPYTVTRPRALNANATDARNRCPTQATKKRWRWV